METTASRKLANAICTILLSIALCLLGMPGAAFGEAGGEGAPAPGAEAQADAAPDAIAPAAVPSDAAPDASALAGEESFSFVVEVTDGDLSFSIPTSGGLNPAGGTNFVYRKDYSWTVEWGDGDSDSFDQTDSENHPLSSGIAHTYAGKGTYTITIKPVQGADEAWLGSFGFSFTETGANSSANRAKVVEVSSPITPSMTRTQDQIAGDPAPSYEWAYAFSGCTNLAMGDSFTFDPTAWTGIGTGGYYFASYMFDGCSGDAFTMGDSFNLPQDITEAGDYFAFRMFADCSGAAFAMGEAFNLPQGIAQAGYTFAGGMFAGCSGDAFAMSEAFNLPQGIIQAGGTFASTMFFGCSGAAFAMNDSFNLPQGIIQAGDSFASTMFFGCSGAAFAMNDAFNLPQGIIQAGDSFAFGMFADCSGDAFAMNGAFNLPQGITQAGEWFAASMFSDCSGDAFAMNDTFNLPQGITQAADNFAYAMFYGCSGDSFAMNGIFNLPQGITQAGEWFAGGMFYGCSGGAFSMNDSFNLPQGIEEAGNGFAASMFYEAGGPSFQVNDAFAFPLLAAGDLDRLGVFSDTFADLAAGTPQQARSAASIIGANPVPADAKGTFAGSGCFADRPHIHANWGGDGALLDRVLVDPATRASVSGLMSLYATLAVEAGDAALHGPGCPACAEIASRRAAGEVGYVFGIAVEGEAEPPFEVSLPVGADNAGRKATVYHCDGGALEVMEAAVDGHGAVIVEVGSLSPFGVALHTAPAPKPEPVPEPVPTPVAEGKGLASAGDVLPWAALTLASAALLGTVLIARRRRG